MNEENKQRIPEYPAVKRKYHADGRDLIFAVLTVVCTFLCVAQGMWGGFQAGYTAAFAVTWLTFTVYLFQKSSKPGLYAWVCGILSLLMSVSFTVTSNGSVRFLSVPVMVLLSWIWFAALCGKRAPEGDPGLLSHWIRCFTGAFTDLSPAMKAIFSAEDEKKKRTMQGLIGVLCALPVLCVVVPLLVRSDAAFEGLIGALFSDFGTTVGQIIVTLCLAPFAVTFVFSLRKRELTAHEKREFKGLEPVILTAFFSVLTLCYLVYLFSQTAYFFSAFSGILPEGYTFSYAEYARRGFFELCGIAAINLCLIFLMILLARKKDGKLSAVLRVFGTFIGLFTLLLIATAVSKMVMYIQNYGMTVQRLCTSAFMAFMAVVFLAVIGRCYSKKFKVLQTAIVTAGVILLVLGAANVNAVCARYNYEAYRSGALEEIDLDYLAQLKEEGAPYLMRLAGEKTPNIPEYEKERAVSELFDRLYYSEYVQATHTRYCYLPKEKIYPKLSQFSISRAEAYREMDAFLEQNWDYFLNIEIEEDPVDFLF